MVTTAYISLIASIVDNRLTNTHPCFQEHMGVANTFFKNTSMFQHYSQHTNTCWQQCEPSFSPNSRMLIMKSRIRSSHFLLHLSLLFLIWIAWHQIIKTCVKTVAYCYSYLIRVRFILFLRIITMVIWNQNTDNLLSEFFWNESA